MWKGQKLSGGGRVATEAGNVLTEEEKWRQTEPERAKESSMD